MFAAMSFLTCNCEAGVIPVVSHPSDELSIGYQRCPFLALSTQQTAANGSKRRHKAKVENRLILRVMAHVPATPSTWPQRAANEVFSAC